MNPKWRDKASYFFGTICFGFNYKKWTQAHDMHHAINGRPLEDPQMNNMPSLLYASRDPAHNNAAALADYLHRRRGAAKRLGARRKGATARRSRHS